MSRGFQKKGRQGAATGLPGRLLYLSYSTVQYSTLLCFTCSSFPILADWTEETASVHLVVQVSRFAQASGPRKGLRHAALPESQQRIDSTVCIADSEFIAARGVAAFTDPIESKPVQ